MAGLYLHIPFCKQACNYCDFHFSTIQKYRPELLSAMTREMALQKDYLAGEMLETVYFGGGTPSLLDEAELKTLLDSIRQNFSVDHEPEITMEVNPDDLSEEKLEVMRATGVDRLSIGIQSFSDEVLTYFNRAHGSAEALQCVQRARSVGFENISIDLIYGIPNRALAVWKKDLQIALELNPEHISAYSLTIEDGTVFGKWRKSGKIVPVADDEVADQFEAMVDALSKAGYDHYEISNFAKPGYYSRHNSNYWKQKKYLGIGPSAHSFDGESRQFNIRNNALYVKALASNQIPFEKEVLTLADKVNEFLLTGLRTVWGCDLAYLESKLNFKLLDEQLRYIDQLVERGLAERRDTRLRLLPKGKLLADKIASDLFVNDEIKLSNFRP